MARYRMADNMVVDTENCRAKWEGTTEWNGRNHISVNTGSQWIDQDLYCSRRGRYYVITSPRMQGQTDSAEWVSNEEAARWLLLNQHELPDDLVKLAEDVME